MSRCLVTGAAGFIGSHLCETLLAENHEVIGIDAFIPYYPRAIKETYLASFQQHTNFAFHETDFRKSDLREFAEGCDVIFHLGAMAGLMRSWSDFNLYASCNLEGTQRLLEAASKAKVERFIHVSTSSVYGKNATGPENSPLQPFSPYGVTKLAAENICQAYAANFGLSVAILRYFSVYGPRQRPDMAYNILIRSIIEQETFPLYGDGEQTRSNTYVADCVHATLLAFENWEQAKGEIFNVGGGEIVSLNKVIELLESLLDGKLDIKQKPSRPGDQKHTAANTEKAERLLGYKPETKILDGLKAQAQWQKEIIHCGAGISPAP